MNASESQHILSRLYMDAVYRNSFLSGKEAFYKEHGIHHAETIAFLNAIKPEQLEFFSKGLYAKKYHEVLRMMPGTAYILKQEMGILFKEFSKTPQTYGVHKHHEETLAFIKFIRKNRIPDRELNAILKFEELLILNFIAQKNWRLALFKYDVVDFLRSLQGGQTPIMKKNITLVLFKNGKLIKYYKAGF